MALSQHLRTPEEWRAVFAKFHRWLRPGGSFWVFDLVSHEDPRVHALLWGRYRDYLTQLGGAAYAEKVFAYVEREDTPASLTFQLALATETGFRAPDVLHKNGPFAAYGAIKGGARCSPRRSLGEVGTSSRFGRAPAAHADFNENAMRSSRSTRNPSICDQEPTLATKLRIREIFAQIEGATRQPV